MKASKSLWLWSAAAAPVVCGAVVALRSVSSTSLTDERPVKYKGPFAESVTPTSNPAQVDPALPADADDYSLSVAYSSDVTSPAGERAPGLEVNRTEHDFGDPGDPSRSGRGLGHTPTSSLEER